MVGHPHAHPHAHAHPHVTCTGLPTCTHTHAGRAWWDGVASSVAFGSLLAMTCGGRLAGRGGTGCLPSR